MTTKNQIPDLDDYLNAEPTKKKRYIPAGVVIKEKPVKLEKNLKETYSVKASNVKETEKKAYDNVINNGSEESKQLIAKIDDYIKRLINRINELGYKHVDSNQYKAPEEIQNYI